jgi:hypothetical protein
MKFILQATSNFVISCHVTFNDKTIDYPERPLSGVEPAEAICPTATWTRICDTPQVQHQQ